MSDQFLEPSEDRYRLNLSAAWLRLDRAVLAATRAVLLVIGSLFTVMIVLEVASRYLADFSIFFINGAAQFLLVWFFLLGAGLALREGGHVGVELITKAVPARTGRVLHGIAQAFTFVFFCQMLCSGLLALPSSWHQTEASTGMSLLWVMLAFPVGFLLLIYHQLVIYLSVLRSRGKFAP
jgi:TRAP-type C4-dicarboxylate transport system permease small subunit